MKTRRDALDNACYQQRPGPLHPLGGMPPPSVRSRTFLCHVIHASLLREPVSRHLLALRNLCLRAPLSQSEAARARLLLGLHRLRHRPRSLADACECCGAAVVLTALRCGRRLCGLN